MVDVHVLQIQSRRSSSIILWSAGTDSQSRLSASSFAHSRMLGETSGESWFAMITLLFQISSSYCACLYSLTSRNTEANTKWAVRTFNSWMEWRNIAKPEDPVPEAILSSDDAQALNKWLSLFFLEARKVDSTKYPTSTLNMLLSGLKRYMTSSNPSRKDFLIIAGICTVFDTFSGITLVYILLILFPLPGV